MSPALVIIITIEYALIAIDQGIKGNLPVFIMYGAYAVANIGVWMLLR